MKQDNSKALKKRKTNAERKHEAMRKRFTELHDKERIRLDDAVSKICEEFYLSTLTVERILRLRDKVN